MRLLTDDGVQPWTNCEGGVAFDGVELCLKLRNPVGFSRRAFLWLFFESDDEPISPLLTQTDEVVHLVEEEGEELILPQNQNCVD